MLEEGRKIKSIEKGWGDGSIYFSSKESWKGSGHHVDKIEPFVKTIGTGLHCDLTLLVYRCFKGDEVICEIESGSSITLSYYKEGEEK